MFGPPHGHSGLGGHGGHDGNGGVGGDGGNGLLTDILFERHFF
jgi:hypothetical protein